MSKRSRRFCLSIAVLGSFFCSQSFANDKMTVFLKSCAYGSLAGAAIGLVSLSVAENPNNKANQVARGSSLGLYAGIGYGYYLTKKEDRIDWSAGLVPSMGKDSVDGARFFLSYALF